PIKKAAHTDSLRKLSHEFLNIKLNSLSQWKLVGIVNGIGLPAHIRFPGITSAFSSTTGFFFTTESPTYFSAGSADIHIGNTTIAAFVREEFFCFSQVQC